MRLRVLVWQPGTAAVGSAVAPGLTEADWDVAVLPGTPPSAAASLAAALEAEWRAAPVRSGLAEALLRRRERPGGAILARWDRIVSHRSAAPRPAGVPGWAHAVQLACGIWVACGAGPAAARAALGWAAGDPLVLAAELVDHGQARLTALGHDLFAAGDVRAGEPARRLESGAVIVGLELRDG